MEAVNVVFLNVPASPALELAIRRKAQGLFRLNDRIESCRVTVSVPHNHHHKGGHYEVRIELGIPGQDLVADRHPTLDGSHENPYVAVRDAFRVARRLLQENTRRHLGREKHRVREGHAAREGELVDGALPIPASA